MRRSPLSGVVPFNAKTAEPSSHKGYVMQSLDSNDEGPFGSAESAGDDDGWGPDSIVTLRLSSLDSSAYDELEIVLADEGAAEGTGLETAETQQPAVVPTPPSLREEIGQSIEKMLAMLELQAALPTWAELGPAIDEARVESITDFRALANAGFDPKNYVVITVTERTQRVAPIFDGDDEQTEIRVVPTVLMPGVIVTPTEVLEAHLAFSTQFPAYLSPEMDAESAFFKNYPDVRMSGSSLSF